MLLYCDFSNPTKMQLPSFFSLMEGLWGMIMSEWIIKMLNIPFQCDSFGAFSPSFLPSVFFL